MGTIGEIVEEIEGYGDWRARYLDLKARALELDGYRVIRIHNQIESMNRILAGPRGPFPESDEAAKEIARLHELLAAAQGSLENALGRLEVMKEFAARLREEAATCEPLGEKNLNSIAESVEKLLQ